MQAREAHRKRLFISYAREDAGLAKKIYADLKSFGVDPWLDIEDLIPGMRWKSEIEKAIANCDLFIALLSGSSISKRGFVQRELLRALEILEEVPEGDVYLIPVRLDECELSHSKFRDLQWVDLFPDYANGFKRLLRALKPILPADPPKANVDDLSKSGWGMLMPADADPLIREALLPLIEHRRSQVGKLYREFIGPEGVRQGDTKAKFMERHGIPPGRVQPDLMPNYLMLVGGPDEITFGFQAMLGLHFRVGRLHFEDLEGYHSYATSLIESENRQQRTQRGVVFWIEKSTRLSAWLLRSIQSASRSSTEVLISSSDPRITSEQVHPGTIFLVYGPNSAGSSDGNGISVSPLAQRLLRADASPAAAFVGTVNDLFGLPAGMVLSATEFIMMEGVLLSILSGLTVGTAIQIFGTRYAELSVEVATILGEGKVMDKRVEALALMAQRARDVVILGDPAARVL